MAQACLRFGAHIGAGVEPDTDNGGVRLAFRREVETRFYNTLTHQFGTQLKRYPPRCPVAFIGGRQSAEVRELGMAATRAVTRGRIDWLEGSHLVPIWQPLHSAKVVLRMLAGAAGRCSGLRLERRQAGVTDSPDHAARAAGPRRQRC